MPQIKEPLKTLEPSRISLLTEPLDNFQTAELELLGTTMGSSAVAFIYNLQDQSSALYKNDDLVAGFKISQILPGKVVLEKTESIRS